MGLQKKVDVREVELPETLFIRDIENRVFQGIVLQCLAKIAGIALIEGNFIDHLLGRSGTERIKGITVEQDSKTQFINIKVEVNVRYGVSIPEKSSEIHAKVSEDVMRLTGLHVSSVHVVFKGVVPDRIGRSVEEVPLASSAAG